MKIQWGWRREWIKKGHDPCIINIPLPPSVINRCTICQLNANVIHICAISSLDTIEKKSLIILIAFMILACSAKPFPELRNTGMKIIIYEIQNQVHSCWSWKNFPGIFYLMLDAIECMQQMWWVCICVCVENQYVCAWVNVCLRLSVFCMHCKMCICVLSSLFCA